MNDPRPSLLKTGQIRATSAEACGFRERGTIIPPISMNPQQQEGFGKDDPLWELLDHASKPPAPNPFFARKVLRSLEADNAPAAGRSWFARFRLARAWVPVAAAIALVAAAGHFWLPQPAAPTVQVETVFDDDGGLPPNPEQRISVVLSDLDDLIALEDNQLPDDDGSWQ